MITAIGMIKNAADIIETFIRCNSMVCDNFVLLDNMSDDNTPVILQKLIEEGFRIEVIPDKESAYKQQEKMMMLLDYVMEHYESDFIIPLDDDEIITSDTDMDVKEYIESLDRDKLHFYLWRNYVPTEEDDPSEICVPKRLNFCYGSKMKTFPKVILSRRVVEKDHPILQMGNHNVDGTDAEKVILYNLHLAHYPCRSEAQIASKALVGWTNLLALPNRRECDGFHWRKAYDIVKNNGKIDIDLQWEICGMYMLSLDNLELEYRPLLLPDKCFELKYTGPNEIDPMRNYMNNVESLAQKYADLSGGDRPV
ncbi:MAG: glycosyltransferase family 2 protein [Eubacterium sp.]|nr:glycosyltransferase family 2 protein [Eubacterium sp.]